MLRQGQEKDFQRFVNTLYFVIDAVFTSTPGAGGGGLATRGSHELAVAGWRATPATVKLKIQQELAKRMGWSVAKAAQMTNVFFSMSSGEGGGNSGNAETGNTGSPQESNLDTPPTYANETVRTQWKTWSREVRQQYYAAQEKIRNSKELVRRVSEGEYHAIFDEGRGTVQDVFPSNVEQTKVFSLDRVYQFSNTARNAGRGYEKVLRLQLNDELRAFLRNNLAPDNLPGGLRGGLKTNPRFKLEEGDFNIVISKSRWNEFKKLIQKHTLK